MHRVFLLEDDHSVALQRLGVGTLLQWSAIPPGVQDAIIQQALALDWTSAPDVADKAIRSLPGRSQHDALDALAFGINRRALNWVLDADIRAFFDCISHDWMMRFLEHRIGDRRVLRLIAKWLLWSMEIAPQ